MRSGWSSPTEDHSRSAPRHVAQQSTVRTEHMHPGERPNGHSHCLQLLLGSSESVSVLEGELALGTWQRLFLVELDGPRPERQVLVQVSGQTRYSALADRSIVMNGRGRPLRARQVAA